MGTKRFNWTIVQEGSLPLRPDGHFDDAVEHRPTSTLIWAENEAPARDNTILVDAYFLASSFHKAEEKLSTIGITFADIGNVFVTHGHYDHLPHFPPNTPKPPLTYFEPGTAEGFAGIRTVPCPGHADDLRALVFTSPAHEQVWVAADAILDEEWLRAWRYYYPNNYSRAEIIQTWRSVAMILAMADLVIPGHGAAIRVTVDLLKSLLEGFPQAVFAEECADVLETLRRRLQSFSSSS